MYWPMASRWPSPRAWLRGVAREGVVDRVEQLLLVGFGHEVDRTALDCADRHRDVGVAADEHDRDARAQLASRACSASRSCAMRASEHQAAGRPRRRRRGGARAESKVQTARPNGEHQLADRIAHAAVVVDDERRWASLMSGSPAAVKSSVT